MDVGPTEPRPNEDAPAAIPTTKDEARCEVCGAFDALEIADRRLCEACYQARASCCNECDDDAEG
jgi:hypothetical protein